MSRGQRFGYMFLGVLIGICISAGILVGVSSYAPEYLLGLPGVNTIFEDPARKQNPLLDQTMLKGIVQDILVSEQGKAIVNDLIRSQTPETLRELMKEVMNSSEFRSALGEALTDFLKTPEGKDVINRIAQEILAR